MRHSLTILIAAIAGGFIAGVAPSAATAAPIPAVTAWDAGQGVVETVDYWRRYYRRHGYPPAGYAPPPPVVDDTVSVDPDGDEEVVVVPVRPASCGQYHYWDGEACVDARYNDPYLGPR